jgi:hypothetical protein
MTTVRLSHHPTPQGRAALAVHENHEVEVMFSRLGGTMSSRHHSVHELNVLAAVARQLPTLGDRHDLDYPCCR